MGLTRVRLGDYIEVSTENNSALEFGCELIRGVTTAGKIVEPKGDTNGVNLKPYKIVKKNAFVYNPSRLDLGSIALSDEELCLVSHLYIVFTLNDKGLHSIDPEWLYMYFRRPEFCREVTFRNFGSQRPEFNCKKLSDIEIPLPSIDIQCKYAAIYESMLVNQRSYEQGLNDLKTSCDALVEKLIREVPSGPIGPYIEQSEERNSRGLGKDAVRGLSIDKQLIQTKAKLDGVSLSGYKVVEPGHLAYVPVTSRNGGKISVALNETDETYITSSINTVFRVREEARSQLLPAYLMLFFGRTEFDRYARFCSWGSARETFGWDEMRNVRIPLPDISTQQCVVSLYQAWRTRSEINERLKVQLKEIAPVLIRGSIEEASR